MYPFFEEIGQIYDFVNINDDSTKMGIRLDENRPKFTFYDKYTHLVT